MLSIKHQYAGFIQSQTLWEELPLFDLNSFQFQPTHTQKSFDLLNNLTISENEVLGKRIERFFELFLNQSSDYTIILKNQQIFADKITIGELDFILKSVSNNCIIHVELVCKFYVYDPKINSELERWIGPNRKDSFLEKIDKLIHKQFPLLYREESEFVLQKNNLNHHNITQQVCFLGNLFVPHFDKKRTYPIVNNACIIGTWVSYKDFLYESFNSYTFYLPLKKDWISTPIKELDWKSFHEIMPDISNSLKNKKSPLLWLKNKEDFFSKLFIVWW